MSTFDQTRRTIYLLSLLEKAQPREKPKWAEEHGLEFDEDKHRWIKPDTGEVHSHSDNDERWETDSPFDSVLDTEDIYEGINDIENNTDLDDYDIQEDSSYVDVNDSEALLWYVDTGHEIINNDLRRGDITNEIKEITGLMKPVREEQLLFRNTGLTLDQFVNENSEMLDVGEIFQYKSFVSTSRSPELAWGWDRDNQNNYVMLEIHTGQDALAISLSNVDTGLTEYETLLNYGQKFRIDKIKEVKHDDALSEGSRYIISTSIVNSDLPHKVELSTDIKKDQIKVKPPFAKEYGFEWSESKKRWIKGIGV